MTSLHERRGALEAIDRIVNRGGDADDVLRDVVGALARLYDYVGIRFVEGDELVQGPAVGPRPQNAESWPVRFQGVQVAELEAAWPDAEDSEFVERVAVLISAYCLVGWDTGGRVWEP